MNKRVIPQRSKRRWALAAKFDDHWRFLGPYCWPDATDSEPTTRTFRTRKQARRARKRLTSYRDEARVVPVQLMVQSVGDPQ